MEELMPIFLTVSATLLGLSILIKVLWGMKFKRIKHRQPQGVFELYMLFAASVLMMWFPYKYDGDDEKLIKIQRRINWITYVFYGLVLLEGLLIYIQIQIIKNGA
ncbi:MAG: hypothetical protein COA57_15170 [Flavobacteriales bacterium]|nr:MAG: hypothetical protein COA57_15170 [Flavobacteriales bacterium]